MAGRAKLFRVHRAVLSNRCGRSGKRLVLKAMNIILNIRRRAEFPIAVEVETRLLLYDETSSESDSESEVVEI